MGKHEFLNRKSLVPAIQDFSAGGSAVGGSAIGKFQGMAKHRAIYFLIVIVSNHIRTPNPGRSAGSILQKSASPGLERIIRENPRKPGLLMLVNGPSLDFQLPEYQYTPISLNFSLPADRALSLLVLMIDVIRMIRHPEYI